MFRRLFLSPLFLVLALHAEAPQAAEPLTPIALKKRLEGTQNAAETNQLHEDIIRLFGRQNLLKGKPSTKIEATTVAWAVMDMNPARVTRGDGTVIGNMTRVGEDGLQVLVQTMKNFQEFNYRIEVDGAARVAGMVHLEHYDYTADSDPQPGVPQGRLEKFQWTQSKIFPDTVRDVTVYIPEQYKAGEEACLMVWQDGSRHVDPKGPMRAGVVFDNLIHKKKMPVTIGVFVDPGRKPEQKPGSKAANRGFEYDSLGDAYVNFLLTEILPEVEKRYPVKFRQDPKAWAIAGGSSGGICSFTAAWERPDKFHKVLSWVGTFVDIRGGNAYPYLVRVTERKPIRVYLLDGVNDLDNKYGNWPLANRMMEASLKYMNYDFRMDWTECFHGSRGMAPHLPEALEWLWRDVK
ncbi:Putative esterase [Prosthecobacter debontii]|uniref:Putative esterase n=1 Tax=Prosthecobacter debontii TaxID=48467 RepID=A0A1T4WIZ4_9BACT|nr:alpha/beta hydrolase-fold protein [Prosthecobacter debontii]SKA77139.1 Putative esterase [Prosthecobacter debontii]